MTNESRKRASHRRQAASPKLYGGRISLCGGGGAADTRAKNAAEALNRSPRSSRRRRFNHAVSARKGDYDGHYPRFVPLRGDFRMSTGRFAPVIHRRGIQSRHSTRWVKEETTRLARNQGIPRHRRVPCVALSAARSALFPPFRRRWAVRTTPWWLAKWITSGPSAQVGRDRYSAAPR